MIQRLLKLVLIAVLMHAPVSADAGVPLDTVKGHVDKVLDVLRDSSLKGGSKEKIKKDKIRTISEKMFDFNELSRRTLGLNWNKFKTEQQQEFIELYKSILEGAYIDKIVSYTDEKIIFNGENPLSEKTVEVQTTVVTKKADIPISYRMIRKEGEWRVYDVIIEGVSLISNYRSQFTQILVNKSPEGLLDTLRKKAGKA
jgi:phospholipid transport system substrate-binding protein